MHLQIRLLEGLHGTFFRGGLNSWGGKFRAGYLDRREPDDFSGRAGLGTFTGESETIFRVGPSTLNPQPSTLNPVPQNPKRKLRTLTGESETIFRVGPAPRGRALTVGSFGRVYLYNTAHHQARI